MKFNLMLGVKCYNRIVPVNEILGVEHWVGGVLEFARLWDQ